MTDGRVLLEDSLRPVSMFLRCNGVLFNFLTPNRGNCLLYIIRCLCNGLIMLAVWSNFAFQLTQCFVSVLENKKLFSIVTTCLLSLFGSTAILIQYQFYVHGKQLQQFFEGWKTVEMQSSDRKQGRKALTLMKLFALSMLILGLISVFFMMVEVPYEVFSPAYYSFIRDRWDIHLIALITAAIAHFNNVYWLLGDIVTCFFYYHAGDVIEDLVAQLQHTSTQLFFGKSLICVDCDANDKYRQERPFRRIWQRYETVVRWVNRANQLFGTVILWSQLVSFVLLVISTYNAVYFLKKDPYLVVPVIMLAAMQATRVLLTNHLLSHLYLSRGNLKSAVTNLLSDDWYRLPVEDRHLLVFFLARLDKEDLAACPMNLFTINPTNLLTILSLIVTYMVVIFQSDSGSGE